MSAPVPLVRLEGLTRTFDDGAVTALRDMHLSVFAGDCLAVVGRSGSGKSCLVNMLSGIDAPSSGVVYWNGSPVQSRRSWSDLRREQIGIVFQEFNLLPTLTALENVELPLFGQNLSAAEKRRRAMESLVEVGLADRVHHLPTALSGGERQRVAIARSIINSPSLLLADEPTGNLDSVNAALIADLLFNLWRSRATTLVLVTHDETLAARCQRWVRLSDGQVIEERAVS